MGRPGPQRSLCWPCLELVVQRKKRKKKRRFCCSLGVVEREDATVGCFFFSCCFRDIPIWNLGNFFFIPSLCVSCFLTLPHLLLLQRNRIFGGGAFSGREDEGHLCPFAAFESVSRIQTVRFHICHQLGNFSLFYIKKKKENVRKIKGNLIVLTLHPSRFFFLSFCKMKEKQHL